MDIEAQFDADSASAEQRQLREMLSLEHNRPRLPVEANWELVPLGQKPLVVVEHVEGRCAREPPLVN